MTALPLLVAPGADSVSVQGATTVAVAGTYDCDVVVVGTGPGGAMAGVTLAKAGKSVIFLEAGGAYGPADFARRQLSWSSGHLYAGRMAQAAMGPPVTIVASGRVVGGGSVVNSAICFRPPAARMAEWSERSGASFWSSTAFADDVNEVWKRIGVLPTHAGIGRLNNQLFVDGLTKLGLEGNWMDRNAPACGGCGVCNFGCPAGAKASVDKALLPEAINHGARIFTRVQVERVLLDSGRAVGVAGRVLHPDSDVPGGIIEVCANTVVIAGSAVGSPMVLQASGVGGPACGEHLSVHPGIPVFADFEQRVDMWDGVVQGAWARDPVNEQVLLETVNLSPSELFTVFCRAGDNTMIERFPHLAMAGAMIRDEGGGRVSRNVDSEGRVRPTLDVHIGPRDMQAFRDGAKLLVKLWRSMGALRVAPGLQPLTWYNDDAAAIAAIDAFQDYRNHVQPYASHPHGTCRMGPREGPHQGVVDERGAVHGTTGLYVLDGSIFPTTLGVNPQVTIMAASLHLSRQLAASL
jgi:choline dehydrogenase-like flavoprotein